MKRMKMATTGQESPMVSERTKPGIALEKGCISERVPGIIRLPKWSQSLPELATPVTAQPQS